MPPLQQVPFANIFARDLTPWSPDIDARKLEKPGIITGQNFLDLADGPVAAFSSGFINYNYWDTTTRAKCTELRVGSDIFYGSCTGIWRINQTSGVAEPLLLISVTETFWPWTVALVGGDYYFAQYNIGLWQFDPDTNSLLKVVTPVGDNVSGVCESNARLIYLTPSAVGVSALDDGTNLEPDLATAAQAQAFLVPGKALALQSVPDGVLVYFTEGIMKGTSVSQAFVFRWTKLVDEVKIWSPNSVYHVPKLGAISIDTNGFQVTKQDTYPDGGYPQPWELEKSDYIKKNIVKYMDQTLYGTVGMYFSHAMQIFFVYFAANTQEGVFTVTFCYSPLSKKWGSFNQPHTGIFEVFDPITNVSTCAYMHVDGFARRFTETDYSDGAPESPVVIADLVYRPLASDPVTLRVNSTGTWVEMVGTNILGSDYAPKNFNAYQLSGLFGMNAEVYSDTDNDDIDDPVADVSGVPLMMKSYINIDVSGIIERFATPYRLPQQGLDSIIEIGPFRYADNSIGNQSSAVQLVVFGMQSAVIFTISEDWQTSALPDEDWDALSGQEDWGSATATPNVYKTTLKDTDDGVNVIFTGLQDLPVFQDLGSSQVFKTFEMSSIWHTLYITADEPGEAWALKTIDITGALTGEMAGV